MKSTEIKRAPCPFCGRAVNRTASFFNDTRPSPGDVSICAYCVQISLFDGNLNLRRPTPEEFTALLEDDQMRREIVTAQQTIKAALAELKKRGGSM